MGEIGFFSNRVIGYHTVLQEDGASLGSECTGTGVRARFAFPSECYVALNYRTVGPIGVP